jgi:microcystin degradation protein MlrC
MNGLLKTLHRPHNDTDLKVPNANIILKSHPRYSEIEGVEFVHGSLDPNNRPVLAYKVPEHFSEELVALAEQIVDSLSSLK